MAITVERLGMEDFLLGRIGEANLLTGDAYTIVIISQGGNDCKP